jgi:TPR repeat protein
MRYTHPVVFFYVLIGLAFFRPAQSRAQQEKPDSPVFKKPHVAQPPLLEQSDVLYEIWQSFLVSRKANAGDPVAQHELGIRYMLGRGIEPDTVKAAYWFAKASAQNMLSSRFNLGIFLFQGWGVPWNPFEAFRAFLSCAEAGMPEAQHIVGLFYTDNMVVPMDVERALYWVRKADEAKYKPAKEVLVDLEKRKQQAAAHRPVESGGTPLPVFGISEADTGGQTAQVSLLKNALTGIEPEMKKALGLSSLLENEADVDSVSLRGIRAAAEVGSPEALALLGRCYEKGIAVQPDKVLSTLYYLRAIRMDSPRAGEMLWRLLQDPSVVADIKTRARKDEADAEYAWAVAIALGFEQFFLQGQAVLTPAQAVQQMRKAADRDHLPALSELGLWYFSGRWVQRDVTEAKKLWHRGLERGSREAEIRLAVIGVREKESAMDTAAALAVLQRGVDDGSVLSQVALGYCYEQGIGVRRSSAEAARWYRAGAQRGSQDAYRALRRMHDALRPEESQFVISEGN